MVTYIRHLPVTPINPKRGIPTASTNTRKLSSVLFVIEVSQRLPDIIFSFLSESKL